MTGAEMIMVFFANGVDGGVEALGCRVDINDGDVVREKAVKASLEFFEVNVLTFCEEIGDLSLCMNTGIGAARSL